MTPLLFVLALARPEDPPPCPPELAGLSWEQIRVHRKAAWIREPMEYVRGILQCEITAARRILDRRPELGREPVCMPYEVEFNICNERRPEWNCARDVIVRYLAEGCLADPYEQPRFHRFHAMYWRRHLDLLQAKRHLDDAAASIQALILRRIVNPSERPEVPLEHLVLDLALHSSERCELAALLRDGSALRHHTAEVDAFLSLLTAPEMAINVAEMRNQVGWALLIAREAGFSREDPIMWFEQAYPVFTIGATANEQKANNLRINMALAVLQAQEPDVVAAERWIAEVSEEEELSAEERLWLDIVRIRIAVARGRFAEALDLQSLTLTRPYADRVPMASWHTSILRGQLLEASEPDQAITAYAEAEAALEAHARERPGAFGTLADGRFTFFARATHRLIDLLHTRDPARAAHVARRARNRATRMSMRIRCTHGGNEDPQPAPGELRLLFTRASRDDGTNTWIGFAVTDSEIVSRALTIPPVPADMYKLPDAMLESWSDALLFPFADAIDSAESVVVLATEDLHAVPFHALPWEDGQLIDFAQVTYGLDWTGCARDEAMATPSIATLVLSGKDPQLIAEADDVTEIQQGAGRDVDSINVTTPENFDRIFSGAYTAVHVAAHGYHEPGIALFESDDRLLFHDDLWLTREDILAARQVPALVMLTACQSSFFDSETLGGGISIAQAFLLAGARFVAASTHDLDDLVATAFARRFYSQLDRGDPHEAPLAWQAAYLDIRDDAAPSSFPSLRMLRLYSSG